MRRFSSRGLAVSLDGKRMFFSVGSRTNVPTLDPDPTEQNRADVLVANPDGSDLHIYASGIRNPVGLEVQPGTGDVWVSVNERDELGDNLLPDYITHVQEGGFYGRRGTTPGEIRIRVLPASIRSSKTR